MVPRSTPPAAGLTRAARIALRVLLVELVVLAATGIALFFFYRPSNAQAWDDLAVSGPSGIGAIGGVRFAHRVVSVLAVWSALAAAVLTTIEPLTRVRWRRSLTLAVAMLVVVVAASGTGYLLPWDQFALWAVSVGSEMRGYLPLLDDNVRFVLLGGKEIGKTTLLRWVVVHGLLGTAGVVLAGGAVRRLHLRAPVPPWRDRTAVEAEADVAAPT